MLIAPPLVVGADYHRQCVVDFRCLEETPLLLAQEPPVHVGVTVLAQDVPKWMHPCAEHFLKMWVQVLDAWHHCRDRERAHFTHHCFQHLLCVRFQLLEQFQQVVNAGRAFFCSRHSNAFSASSVASDSKIGPANALPLKRSRSDSGDSGRVRSKFSTTRCNDLAFQIASCVSQLALQGPQASPPVHLCSS